MALHLAPPHMWGSYGSTYVRRRHCTPLMCRYHLLLYLSYVRHAVALGVYKARVFAFLHYMLLYMLQHSVHFTRSYLQSIQELLPLLLSLSLSVSSFIGFPTRRSLPNLIITDAERYSCKKILFQPHWGPHCIATPCEEAYYVERPISGMTHKWSDP